MKTIITIQHTQSIHHTNGMVGSWTDWELSDLGKEQAENIGRNLSDELSQKYVIYSSDLLRAKQTAEAVGRYLGTNPVFRQELRERNLGEAVGKSVQWLRENWKNRSTPLTTGFFPLPKAAGTNGNALNPSLMK